ncbi:MAG TPA: alpha/beta hydrolase [Thermodesulfobacteriota bacterium]
MNFNEVEEYSGTIISIPFNSHKIDALHYHIDTHSNHREHKPVIVRLHGVLGNILDETEHYLPSILADNDFSSVTMNTILANLGLFFGFGIFDDTIPQIDAVCDYLRNIGFRKIIIAGHGLGGSIALRYCALRNDIKRYPDLNGVIVIATPFSMPDTIRRRWERFGSEPSYDEVYERAKRIFNPEDKAEPAHDETIIVKKAHGPTNLPEHTEIYTLKTWWALSGPEAEGAKAYKQIGNIKDIPVLLVHASKDEIIEGRDSEDLCEIAKSNGNKDVTHVNIDANHSFDGRHDELAQAIINWLNDRF